MCVSFRDFFFLNDKYIYIYIYKKEELYKYTKKAIKRSYQKQPKKRYPQEPLQTTTWKNKKQKRKKWKKRLRQKHPGTHQSCQGTKPKDRARSYPRGERQKPPPQPPSEPRQTTTKTLPIPAQDRLHLPLMIRTGTSRALS